ncbi:hypothetical protein KCU88_g5576, partial [Aureobasidium melanogenum]
MMTTANYVHPSTYESLSDQEISVVRQIHDFTEKYFQNPCFDASHDFDHVKRVVNNALAILKKEEHRRKQETLPPLNPLSVILGALLHDVEDRKYIAAMDNDSPLKRAIVEAGMPIEYAAQIQMLVEGVSYSSEVKNPDRVRNLIAAIPELAIVQDADRLDAIGAIGIGRCFTFGGAKGARSLEDSIHHFEDKLLKLEGMMKTDPGKAMAHERTRRIREFMAWWREEAGSGNQ